MQRIGIFSGTFDPVHVGHLAVAQACLTTLKLDKVLMVPCGKPLIREPFASAEHRFHMLETAARENKKIRVSDIDMQKTPRYTVDMVREAQKKYKKAQLVYIVGADKLPDIPRWREAGALFQMCEFAAFPRAGYDAAALCEALREQNASVTLLPFSKANMSSGQIRSRLRLLSDAPGMLLPDVAEYIAANGLYQPEYERTVSQALSPGRFAHSLGVRTYGARLARIHGAPMQKAGVAAILHDCAKNMELARLQFIALRTHENMDPLTLRSNALLHGLVGAQVAKTRYHISDGDILNAIRYHTTGRADMSLLELVIFVADAAEPGRDYPGVGLVRKQAESDLRKAALMSLIGTQQFVNMKGGVDSPLTRQAIFSLREQLRDHIA